MSKKYLSIEEAAQMLGMETSELNRLREKSEIRAFANSGTWKFKLEDVENLGRSRQADSDPEFPLHDIPSSSGDVLSEDDEDALSEQPTIIRRPASDETSSDSDVRLIFDDSMGVTDEGSDDDIGITLSDSDSDVQLASESKVSKGAGSDSDVRLVGHESSGDVKLVDPGSDSDVKLVGTSGSDSDVAIVSDRKPAEKKGPKSGKGKDFELPVDLSDDDEESFSLAPLEGDAADRTINLAPVGESGSVLDDDDEDSGISLAGDDSGLSLASASGISLERPNDSGISLSDDSALQLTGDSGITLADDGGSSGISLAGPSPSSKVRGKKPSSSVKGGKSPGKGGKKPPESSDDLHATLPMMESPLLDDDDSHDTQMEVPLFDDMGQDSDLDISGGHDSTSVITLDDEEDVDVQSPTMVKKKRSSGDDSEDLLEDGMFDTGGTEEIEEMEDVEVSDDVIGEDDELEDVFGAEDEDFDAGMETGESHADIPVSAPARGMAAPIEYDWGVPSFVGLALSTVLMIVCGTVMFDLVRNMWYMDAQNLNPVSSTLLDALRDTFKG